MDLPSLPVELESMHTVDAPWGPAGRACFSPRHDCFVLVLAAPTRIELGAPGPRVLASSSMWVAVEDCVGVTAAALLATTGVDRVEVALRRFIWRLATADRQAVPRTDQIWLGFDGRVVVAVPRRDQDGDHDAGLLALALDVDANHPDLNDADDNDDNDDRQRQALVALIDQTFPTRARAYRETLELARRTWAAPTATTTTTTTTTQTTTPTTALDAAGAMAALRALDARPFSIPPQAFTALPAVIDDDSALWGVWKPAAAAPPPVRTSAELARLNDLARVHRVAATFGRVFEALAQRAPDFVSIGDPWDVQLTFGGCDFREDVRHRALPRRTDDSVPPPFKCRYVPPEQAVGAALDIRASLYVVGVHLYEALAGCHPFWSSSAVGFAALHAMKAPPPLVQVNPGVHPGLAAVTMTLLQKKPADRYATPALALIGITEAIRRSPAA